MVTEEAFRDSARALLETGKPADVLHLYRNFAEWCERDGIAISLETLEVVEEALHALDRKPRSKTHASVPGRIAAIRWMAIAGIAATVGLCVVSVGYRQHNPLTAVARSAPAPTANACLAEGDRLYQSARYSEALGWDTRSYVLFTQHSFPSGAASALLNMGRDTQAQGRLASARQLYEQALAIRRASGTELNVAAVSEVLGGLQTLQGDYPAARKSLTESLDLRTRSNDLAGIIECESDLGALAAEQAQFADAGSHFNIALSLAVQNNKPEMVAAIRGQLGGMASDQGDFRAARSLLTRSMTYWVQRGHQRWIAGMERQLSVVALGEGQLIEAETRAERSLDRYRRVGDQLGEAKASMVLANALFSIGDRARADSLALDAKR